MNWEMISAVGQMLGAIGVIISIIYLAAQIRNQNKESRRAAMNVLTTHWSDLNKSLVNDADFAALWLRALQSFDQLDGASKLRFGAHLGRFLRFADSLYLSVLDGTLDKRLWRGYERTLADTVAYPGFQTWWAARKHWHTVQRIELRNAIGIGSPASPSHQAIKPFSVTSKHSGRCFEFGFSGSDGPFSSLLLHYGGAGQF